MRHAPALALMLALALGAAACGDADEAAPSEPAAPAAATEEATDAVDDVLAACQDRDRDRLRDRLDDELADEVRDRDRDRLFAADDVTIELVSRTVEVDGDTATVTATFDVTRDGETTQVERVWVLELADDGTWVLTEVPDCILAD